MDTASSDDARESHDQLAALRDCLQLSCNWRITNGKQFHHAVTTTSLVHAPERMNCENVVSLDTCIALQADSESTEPCMLDIKLTNNRKIARLAVVSEASILEFFKQSGEYETTVFAEFIDEFENNSVYLAETTIQPPTTEAGIKFTRTKSKNPTMWIYGIRLILTDPVKERNTNAFDYDIIRTFLSNIGGKDQREEASVAKRIIESFNTQNLNNEQFCQESIENLTSNLLPNCLEHNKNRIVDRDDTESSNCTNNCRKLDVDIRMYIDDKLNDMEKRLMKRLDEMEANTHKKLDAILRMLPV